MYPLTNSFFFSALVFMGFFSLSSVFTVLWIVLWLPSLGEPWELAGNEWLARKRGFLGFFFPLLLLLLLLENNLGEPSDEKNPFFCQLLPGASVRLFKAFWEVVQGKVAPKAAYWAASLTPKYIRKKTKNQTKTKPKQGLPSSLCYQAWLKLNIQAPDTNVLCRNLQ